MQENILKQKEVKQACKTCGTENSIYESYCKVCQSVLEGTGALQAIDEKAASPELLKHFTIPRSPAITRHKKKPRWVIVSAIPVVSILLVTIIPYLIIRAHSLPPAHVTATPATLIPVGVGKDGIGVTRINNEYIGVSDGRFILDTNRVDGSNKLQAAASLRSGNLGNAMAQWESALTIDSSDAEPLIYLEDQRVLASGSPFVTYVVFVTLAPVPDGYSRSVLQGAYIEQKENNDNPQLSGGIKIRLLIASSGSDANRSGDVAHQVVQAAQSDKTIVGVLNGATSLVTLNTVQVFVQAHIPMVASMANADELTNLSPYFFRISPPNKVLGSLLTTYIEHKLKPQRLVLFVDNNEPFSRGLASGFEQKYTSDGYDSFYTQEFKSGGNPEVLSQSVRDVLNRYHPDVIFMTSIIAGDITTLLNAIPSTQQFADLKVVEGTAAYELIGGGGHFTGYTRLRFLSSGFADEWLLYSKRPLPFFTDYAQAFDPQKKHTGSPYGYTRPAVYAMLAYDGTKTLLAGSLLALKGGKQTFTPDELRQALSQLNGSQAVQGVTGIISLGADGNPVNKVGLVLRVDSSGRLQMDAVQGCFDMVSCTNEVRFLN
jgi:ABC-type branched-subunit amino acid transport system substrate-binding protein